MKQKIILASGSPIRAELLDRARVPFEVEVARLDEDAIKQAMIAQHAKPRDIADALAEAKARKISSKHPDALVLGCDQVLAFGDTMFSKPKSQAEAVVQLQTLSGHRHSLLSAAVIYEGSRPVWRHIGQTRLYMRQLSQDWITDYVARNWSSIQYSVGGYKIEEEGVRVFERIDGDHFTILGMPLIEILSYLTLRGILAS